MLVLWLLLTLNLVLVHSSEVQICDNNAGNCTSETNGNQTISTTVTTLSPVSNATEVSSNFTTTAVPSLVNATTTAVPNSDGETTQKPQVDDEASRNSSSSSIQGRAMNFDAQENKPSDTQTSMPPEKGSLQDLSLDDIDETSIIPMSMDEDKTNSTATPSSNSTSVPTNATEKFIPLTKASNTSGLTMANGSSCVQGQTFERGCSEKCECGSDGKAICRPRCTMPFFRRGAPINDPACIEKPSEDDPCCSMMVCTQDTETETLEGCTFKNQSYQRGETINSGCEAVCTCGEAGHVSCKPRCPPVANNSSADRCVELSDPTDPCCKVVLCDVTLGDHDVSKAGAEESTPAPPLQLLILEIVNETSVRLGLTGEPQAHHENLTVESSLDQKTWIKQQSQGLLATGLEPGHTHYLRVKSGSMVSNAVVVSLPFAESQPSGTAGCMYKGRHYTAKEEFHDGCEAYCACTDSGVQCATIECPTEFGLDVLDPNCVDWETHPPNFKPTPPNCCPEQVRCRNNGSCIYEGEMFNNWAEIPLKLTGCAKRCYCELGNVSCQSTCPPVTAAPPSDLQCGPQQPILSHLPGDDCCLFWMCPQNSGYNVTMMHDRPTEQRQSENDTAKHGVSAVKQPGPTKPNGLPGQHQTFLPLNPDYVPPELVPLIEPLKTDEDNYTKPIKHEHPAKQKHLKDDTKKSHAHDDHHIHETTVEPVAHTPDIHETVEEYSPPPSNKSQNLSMPVENQPYDVKPPFLPEYGDETIDDTNQPIIWGPPHLPPPQDKGTPGSPVRAPQDHRQQNFQNNLNPEDYFVNSNERPGHGPEEVYHIQAVPSHPGNQHQRPSVQHLDASDPHLDQILKHLQNQGILPEHYTVLQHDGPPHQQHQSTKQNDAKTRPDNRPVHEEIPEDYPIPPHPGRLPPQYHPSYIPKPIPRPGQHPVLYQQNVVPQPHPNNPLSRLPHHYPKQVGRQPDSDGPVIAHIPYQDLLVPQYHGVSHVPPHVDIDHLLLTANGRHNQSQPGVTQPHLPPGFFPLHPNQQDEITVNLLEPVDENTVKLVFSVPPVLVGLHGRVELRYTSDIQNNEPSTWNQQVFAPHGDLIATPQLEFELGELQPDTLYKIKITVILRDLQNSPTSKILKVRTPPPAVPSTTLPPQIPVDVGLKVMTVNSTWAKLEWRKFNEFELQFVDGVQIRYKEREGKVYAATPLIHRAVTSYTLEDLRPRTEYEVGIFFIPFPGQTTELIAERNTHLTTADVDDLYKFNVTLDVQNIKSTSVELSWNGVPYPQDKYVNIFRAIYQSDAGKEDTTFKIAKRDSQARTIVQDLKPGTRYRLWLEVYLTNGKIKKSNVQDFMTKPGTVSSVGSTQQGKLKSGGPEPLVESTDYYGPLVAVAIIAALAIVAALILLLILMRKHGTNKAAISATRKTQSAYDNPSYKTSENDPAAAANGGTGAKTVEQP